MENTRWVLSPPLDRKTTVVGVIKNLAGQTAGPPGSTASNRLGSIDCDDKQCFSPCCAVVAAIKPEYCRDTNQRGISRISRLRFAGIGTNVSFRSLFLRSFFLSTYIGSGGTVRRRLVSVSSSYSADIEFLGFDSRHFRRPYLWILLLSRFELFSVGLIELLFLPRR